MHQLSALLLLVCFCSSQQLVFASSFFNYKTVQSTWNSFFGKSKDVRLAYLQDREMALYNAISLRKTAFNTELKTVTPVQFPEASAMSLFMIDKAAGYLDQWMENNEQSRDKVHCRVIAKHVLFCRPEDCKSVVEPKQPSSNVGNGKASSSASESVNTEAFTSFLIFRPSYTAQLTPGVTLPVDEYTKEAKEVAGAVAAALRQHPQDQFIFVGLQGGAAVALFSAWQALIDVDQLFYNWYAYDDRLHQIKLFLFESDCILSSHNFKNYPLPAWDILRFYSPRADASTCSFDNMSHIGLPYQVSESTLKLLMEKLVSKLPLEKAQEVIEARSHFQNYYFGALFSNNLLTKAKSLESHEDDEVMSQISASTGRPHRADSIRDVVPETDNDILKLIENGTKLLRKSMRLSKEFKTNVSAIYNAQRRSFMQRDVDNCAFTLSTIMETAFVEKLGGSKNYQIVNGIKSIQCKVEEYSILTGLAQVTCVMIGRDDAESKLIRFEASVDRIYRDTALQSSYVILGIDETEKSVASPAPGTKAAVESDSYSVYDDNRSHYTGAPYSVANAAIDKSNAFGYCLRDLFDENPDGMKYLNPNEASQLTQAALTSGRSFVSVESPIRNGFLSFGTNLAYSQNRCNCKFSLKTTTLDYFSIYNTTPSIFFSLFWNSMRASLLPATCENVILPPKISNSDRGHAEKQLRALSELFSRTKRPGFNESQDTDLLGGTYATIQDKSLFVECLADSPLDHLYNCNESVAKWAGKSVCPDYCRAGGFGSHLCSRVLACRNGLFLAFRGASILENTVGTGGATKENILKHFLELDSSALPPGCSVFSFNATPGKLLASTIYFAVFTNVNAATDRTNLSVQYTDEHQQPVFPSSSTWPHHHHSLDGDYEKVEEASSVALIYAQNSEETDNFETNNPAKRDDERFEEDEEEDEYDEKDEPLQENLPSINSFVEEKETIVQSDLPIKIVPEVVANEKVNEGKEVDEPLVPAKTEISIGNTSAESFEDPVPLSSTFNAGTVVNNGSSGTKKKKKGKNGGL